ncbi:MAG: PEP-CTERM sorting domain-containing protein [Bryobacterales bacterium]|nr:PEP-CTERM sorting domain-containing protein [Bryobacterales bacterium]
MVDCRFCVSRFPDLHSTIHDELFNANAGAVPEPSTMALLGISMAMLALTRKRRR